MNYLVNAVLKEVMYFYFIICYTFIKLIQKPYDDGTFSKFLAALLLNIH